jgi:tetratricopeptide (TPR) repeat protein
MSRHRVALAVAHALLVVVPVVAGASIPPESPWPSGAGVLRDALSGLTPVAPHTRARLVQSYLTQGRADLAARELRTLTAAAERDAVARTLLARNAFHVGAARAIAALYVRERRPGDAIRILEEAARAHPAVALPLVDVAQIHERFGDTAAATDAYRAALRREPDNALALNNFAFFLSADPRQVDEALRLAERAYRQAPANPAVADTLGWLLYLKGDLDRAETLLEEALQRLPDNAQVRYHLGMVYARRGKTAEARHALEEALKSPGLAEAGEARRTLRSLP